MKQKSVEWKTVLEATEKILRYRQGRKGQNWEVQVQWIEKIKIAAVKERIRVKGEGRVAGEKKREHKPRCSMCCNVRVTCQYIIISGCNFNTAVIL